MSHSFTQLPQEELRRSALQITRSASLLATEGHGQPDALANVLLIIQELGVLARDVIDREFPVSESIETLEGRRNWMRLLYMLSRVGTFPGLTQLHLVLGELSRGHQLASVKPLIAGSGTKPRKLWEELLIHKRAVEAADRLDADGKFFDEKEAVLKECGTTHATIETYRQACMLGIPQLWPENGAMSHLSFEDTKAELKSSIASAKYLHKYAREKASER